MPPFLTQLIGHLLTNALGSKVSTAIGLLLGYLNAAYVDYSQFIPAKYAGTVQVVISVLIAIFGAYVVDPQQVQATAQKQLNSGLAVPLAPTS